MELVLDVTPISYIIRSYNPNPTNWLSLLVDVNENHGFSLRLSVVTGLRLLCWIPDHTSATWWLENWCNALLRIPSISAEQVLFHFFTFYFKF